MDQQGFMVYYNSQNLKLTLSEYFLFQILFENPNRVFTREQLINHIFNDEYYGSDRIIDAHIKNLRKKLPVDQIETVIRLGYRWKGE